MTLIKIIDYDGEYTYTLQDGYVTHKGRNLFVKPSEDGEQIVCLKKEK